jgi:hypothetical protein
MSSTPKKELTVADVYNGIMQCCNRKYAALISKEAEEILCEHMTIENLALIIVKGKLEFISRKKIKIKK